MYLQLDTPMVLVTVESEEAFDMYLPLSFLFKYWIRFNAFRKGDKFGGYDKATKLEFVVTVVQ